VRCVMQGVKRNSENKTKNDRDTTENCETCPRFGNFTVNKTFDGVEESAVEGCGVCEGGKLLSIAKVRATLWIHLVCTFKQGCQLKTDQQQFLQNMFHFTTLC
jgi:hypothetical protein